MGTLQKPKYSCDLMWKPTNITSTNLAKFASMVSKKYDVKCDNYWDLHKWSTENIEEYWAAIWDYLAIIHSKTYDRVVIENHENWLLTKWFPGAKLNFAENLLRYRDDHTALIITGEERCQKKITYSQLYEEVVRYAAALKRCGLKKGDRVACYMSNREEAVFAFLGTVALGGIWVGTLPLFGAKGVISRFQQTSPKFLFTIDRHKYGGEEKDMINSLMEISKAISCLEKIIVVPSKDSSLERDIFGIRNSCFLNSFLSKSETILNNLEFEQVEFDYPVIISFTSGTTGIPKAMIHGCGSLLANVQNFVLHGNGSRDEVYLATSPSGWATWIMFLTTLAQGSCIVLYEGSPFSSRTTSLWDLVENHHITQMAVTASSINEMEKHNMLPKNKDSLKSLKCIMATSCAVKPQAFDFFYKKLKFDALFGSGYGTTEVNGYCIMSDFTLPVYRGEISAPTLGVATRCFNEKGESVEGEMGELVLVRPTPALPVGFWGDSDGSLFRNEYFGKYSGVFCIKDLCLINPDTRGTIILGRSDETLKSAGTRFGSSEIYTIVEDFSEVADSLCVTQYINDYDGRNILFLKLSPGYHLSEDFIQRIQHSIKSELSKRHVPDVILEIKEIPYNMNGKKMESTVKKIINKMPYNTDSVKNQECLSLYRNIPELKFF